MLASQTGLNFLKINYISLTLVANACLNLQPVAVNIDGYYTYAYDIISDTNFNNIYASTRPATSTVNLYWGVYHFNSDFVY